MVRRLGTQRHSPDTPKICVAQEPLSGAGAQELCVDEGTPTNFLHCRPTTVCEALEHG
jgi:hypothetical protein